MSDDQLDDEAPPSIPDIGSQPEIAPIPELPPEIPPASVQVEAPRLEISSELDVEIDVEVESEPGQGAIFHVWLPLSESPGSHRRRIALRG